MAVMGVLVTVERIPVTVSVEPVLVRVTVTAEPTVAAFLEQVAILALAIAEIVDVIVRIEAVTVRAAVTAEIRAVPVIVVAAAVVPATVAVTAMPSENLDEKGKNMLETYVVHVTKACNCDCLYCYEKDKTSSYTFEEVKCYLDQLLKHRTADEFVIEFLGGEPMLAWDIIRSVYEYLEAKEEISVPSYVITTNGTILNEEMADYLSKNPKLRFAASLDGHSYANQLRVFKESRKNTYDKVLENIRMLQAYGVEASIHMVTHPYNVAMIADSIDILYEEGIRSIGLGTVESTMLIDEAYCSRFVSECDLVSKKICDGTYPGLSIAEFESVKPASDVRSYIRDESGKVVGESYGRSGEDITHGKEYDVTRCAQGNEISEMIQRIRQTVYENHQKNKRKAGIV